MSQTYYDDCYNSQTLKGSTVLTRIKNNFASLKSCFSGDNAPANPVGGMWWADTTNNILKQRDAANERWIGVVDLENECIYSGGLTEDSLSSGLRKASIITGEDIAPADCSLKYVPPGSLEAGDYEIGYDSGIVFASSVLQKICSVKVNRSGTIRVKTGLQVTAADMYGQIYKNGTKLGPLYLLEGTVFEVGVTHSDDYEGVAAGDVIQLYARVVPGFSFTGSVRLSVCCGNPIDAGGTYLKLFEEVT